MKRQLRIHYFQHEPYEGPGCIGDWAEKEDHLLSCTRFYDHETPPALSKVDLLVIMGGSMGIYDEKDYPWLIEEKRYIKNAINANKVIIGICLGAQLLADACGAKVKRAKYKEIGWFPIRKTEAGKASALLSAMPEQLDVFHWHGDQFDIPDGCFSLAESTACAYQLFQFGDRVMALQFHFEATASSISRMLQDADNELEEAGPYVQTKSDIMNGLHHCARNNEIMFFLLDQLSQLAT
jgi:GMP synthase-like glutamine amidotransferase